MIYAASNLTEQTVSPCEPWKFVPTEMITDQIRYDNEERQNFYRNVTTRHCFYTLVEGFNPNQRVSREDNPPRRLHGIAADFDVKIAPEAITAAIELMQLKPAWVERSLGGNARLVWLFPKPLAVESYDFCVALLQSAQKWLRFDLLPGLDAPAAEDPTRLYCNGCDWIETGAGALSEDALQAFFVEAGRQFRFTTKDGVEIPLDVIEKELAAKFPHFCWPSDFQPESTGPSFWVPGSQSSNSAILKLEGFFTFSAHADKPFYTWADILGAEFVKQFTTAAISKATTDIWFDSRKFWRKKKGCYVPMEAPELTNYLQTACGITAKGGKLAQTMAHIYEENCVENAAPYLFRPPGLLVYQNRRRLNTSVNHVIQPATGTQTWGGNFPFLASLLDSIFTTEIQRDHFLAWFKYFYDSGLNNCPMPGQVIFLMGGVETGKTFTSREIVGRSVGGFMDASGYIIRSGEFNSHLFESALWALDDDTIGDSPQAAANVQAMLKKSVANSSFLSNKKFQSAGMVEWMGRIAATTNLDYISSRLLGPLDNSSLDKISIFRCQSVSKIKFPSRSKMERLVSIELPYLLRWLTDHTPPDYVERDSRFGFKSWHEPSLMDQAAQTSKSSPFKELLIETLESFFRDNPEATEWRGTVSKLIQQLHMNPLHESVIRTLRLEQVSRYLESIEKDGALKCRVETGQLNTRIWVFARLNQAVIPGPTVPPLTSNQGSVFNK